MNALVRIDLEIVLGGANGTCTVTNGTSSTVELIPGYRTSTVQNVNLAPNASGQVQAGWFGAFKLGSNAGSAGECTPGSSYRLEPSETGPGTRLAPVR